MLSDFGALAFLENKLVDWRFQYRGEPQLALRTQQHGSRRCGLKKLPAVFHLYPFVRLCGPTSAQPVLRCPNT